MLIKKKASKRVTIKTEIVPLLLLQEAKNNKNKNKIKEDNDHLLIEKDIKKKRRKLKLMKKIKILLQKKYFLDL